MTQENTVSVATVFTRLATPSDIPQINGLIYKLAEFEQLTDECFATEEKLKSSLFNLPPMQVIRFLTSSAFKLINSSMLQCCSGIMLFDILPRSVTGFWTRNSAVQCLLRNLYNVRNLWFIATVSKVLGLTTLQIISNEMMRYQAVTSSWVWLPWSTKPESLSDQGPTVLMLEVGDAGTNNGSPGSEETVEHLSGPSTNVEDAEKGKFVSGTVTIPWRHHTDVTV